MPPARRAVTAGWGFPATSVTSRQCPRAGLAAYLALAMHSRVTSLDPATTLLLPGGITMAGAPVSLVPRSPVAESTSPRTLLSTEG